MNKLFLMATVLVIAAPATAAPPPGLASALAAWAAPRTIERYQISQIDLNADNTMEVVVHVTDPAFCGNGGCPLVVFSRSPSGFAVVATSGLVRKPVYVLEENSAGWLTLAAVVGLDEPARVVPIRYKVQEQVYRSQPYKLAQIELTTDQTKRVLNFEEVADQP